MSKILREKAGAPVNEAGMSGIESLLTRAASCRAVNLLFSVKVKEVIFMTEASRDLASLYAEYSLPLTFDCANYLFEQT
jgi:hypothetical protein